MKTINEAAEQYCNPSGYHSNIATETSVRIARETMAFKKGVEFAQRWNETAEVKPPPLEWVLVKFLEGIPPAVGRYAGNGYWNFPYYDGNHTITHWRYIELK